MLASVAVNGRSATVYEEVHTLAKDKRCTHQAFLRQLQAVLPVGCRPIIVTDAGFRTPWFQQVASLGWDWVGWIRNWHKMRWCSGGRWFDANRCYQRESSMANYLGQAVLTRSASVERLQVLVFIASLALLVLWLVGTATIAQGAHYQFQANSVRHKRILSVLFVGLQLVQDTRIILTRAGHEGRLVSAPPVA